MTALASRLVPKSGDAALYPVFLDFTSDFGRCVGVDLAAANDADAAALRRLLHPEERALCGTMRGARLVEFVGGRVAARHAREALSGHGSPVLAGPGGMPTADRAHVSISHSRRFAVALAAADQGCTIGIDIEPRDDDADVSLLAERILTEDERRGMDPGEPPSAILRLLSLKEAAWKALFPRYGHTPLRAIAVLASEGRRHQLIAAARGDRIAVRATMRDVDGHVLSLARLASPS